MKTRFILPICQYNKRYSSKIFFCSTNLARLFPLFSYWKNDRFKSSIINKHNRKIIIGSKLKDKLKFYFTDIHSFIDKEIEQNIKNYDNQFISNIQTTFGPLKNTHFFKKYAEICYMMNLFQNEDILIPVDSLDDIINNIDKIKSINDNNIITFFDDNIDLINQILKKQLPDYIFVHYPSAHQYKWIESGSIDKSEIDKYINIDDSLYEYLSDRKKQYIDELNHLCVFREYGDFDIRIKL